MIHHFQECGRYFLFGKEPWTVYREGRNTDTEGRTMYREGRTTDTEAWRTFKNRENIRRRNETGRIRIVEARRPCVPP